MHICSPIVLSAHSQPTAGHSGKERKPWCCAGSLRPTQSWCCMQPGRASRADPVPASSQWLPDSCDGQHSFSITSKVSSVGQGIGYFNKVKNVRQYESKAIKTWLVHMAEDMHVISLFLPQTCTPLWWMDRSSADSQAGPDESDFYQVCHLRNIGQWE